MKAEDKSFYFLATPSYYDVPFFQREYVWTEENWSELLENLTSKTQNHFLGSIILKSEGTPAGSVNRYSVIDGQQRLTTLSILLRACFDHIVKYKDKYELDDDFVKTCQVKTEELLFVSENGFKPKKYVKINHSHLDKKAFESVIMGEFNIDDRWQKFVDLPDDDDTSQIIRAYAYFRDELNGYEQDKIESLWNLLTMNDIKFLININLNIEDNEQAIFDTVNSSGVRLSSADTIKNLLYQKYVELLRQMHIDNVDEEAVKEYEMTWVEAFLADEKVKVYWETQRQYGRMKRSNIETMLHAFAVVKGIFNPSEDNMADLPKKFRKHVSSMNIDELGEFLKLMHDYAEVFREFFNDGDDILDYSNYVGRIFNICNSLEVSTFYPYILQLLYARKTDNILEEQLKEDLFALEKYIVLNAICKGSTKNYNNECTQLVEKKKTPKEIMQSCIYISDADFSDGLRRMTTNKLPTLLLFWVELYLRSLDKVDLKGLKYEFTLEHIMPQKWAQNWSDVPCYDKEKCILEDAEEIGRTRNHAIYEIGNMTLLNSKLNSSISNGTFQDKLNGKNGKQGIKDLADLLLTKEVTKNEEWDERKIYDRTAEIEKLIRIIWDVEELPKEKMIKSKNENFGSKEIRIRFWEKALPIIREMNNYQSFNNVNPRSSNVIFGYFGIGGFSIACTANLDKASVDFCLNKSETEKNKEAFDILYDNRIDIENELGVSLNWDRADDLKISVVSYKMDGVSVTDENDWDKMASFLGEWSMKLRSVLVPFLEEKFPKDNYNVKSPEEVERLLNIAELLREWMAMNPNVDDHPERSNRSLTRFCTKKMTSILPEIPGVKSDWNCEHHYFYELTNRSGDYVDCKLSFNSKNMNSEMFEVCKRISEASPMKLDREKWQWWISYKTNRIYLPDNLDKDIIFERLDKALEEVFEYEDSIINHFI